MTTMPSWFKVQFLSITYVSCTCTVVPFPMLVSNDISFTGPEWGFLVVLRHSHTTFITVLILFSLILPIVHGTDFFPYAVIPSSKLT